MILIPPFPTNVSDFLSTYVKMTLIRHLPVRESRPSIHIHVRCANSSYSSLTISDYRK